MGIILKAGSSAPAVMSRTRVESDTDREAVVIEGLYSALRSADVDDLVPEGYAVDTKTTESTGNGWGRIVLSCSPDGATASTEPRRTTFRIAMEAVTYDLQDHPKLQLAASKNEIVKWLATDEAIRVDGTDYYYTLEDGTPHPVSDQWALKFCAAFMAGIKTFNRYYPVIEKISYWDNPPGVTKSGKSYTGGSFTEFSGAGHYEAPPITLPGCAATNWYKSGDDWVQQENKVWVRTEQWTYTPESSSDDHAWIYSSASNT